MGLMVINTNFEKEVATSMRTKLQQIDDDVKIEKEKVKDCRSAIKKSITSLCELLNGEELSEEEKVETPTPMPSLGGTDVKSE